jgi:hypothetical protein
MKEAYFPIRLRTLTKALIFAHIYYTKLTEEDSRTGEPGGDDDHQDMGSMLVFDHGGIEPDPAYQLQNDVLELIYAQAARCWWNELRASLFFQAGAKLSENGGKATNQQAADMAMKWYSTRGWGVEEPR